MRWDTKQKLPRQRASEWFPLKGQALCFSYKVDNAQIIAALVCRMSSPWLCDTQGRKSFHPSRVERRSRTASEVTEKWLSSQTSLLNTHAQREQGEPFSLDANQASASQLLQNKRFRTNGIRFCVNSDGVPPNLLTGFWFSSAPSFCFLEKMILTYH